MSEIEPLPRRGRGRCGCGDSDCGCIIESGNMTVSGTGSEGDPITFTADVSTNMAVIDSATVNMTLSGTGTSTDPYIVSGGAITLESPGVYYFWNPDEIHEATLPNGVSMIHIIAVGAGGSGAGSQPGADSKGGGGGQGGYFTEIFAPWGATSPMDIEVYVGVGGQPQAGDDGEDGGDTWVRLDGSPDYLARASGGKGGLLGAAEPGGLDAGIGLEAGGYGGFAWAGTLYLPGESSRWAGGGGGCGQSLTGGAVSNGQTLAGYSLRGSGYLTPFAGGDGGSSDGDHAGLAGGGGGGGGHGAAIRSGGAGGDGAVWIEVW